MFRKLILILFSFLFCGSRAFADTFVVTSNSDSGPGTLREALTLAAANGSAVKDYINFNLPHVSEADRTITLLSNLPTSSNLIIDGTTQPGIKFGISDAKVKILALINSTYPITYCFDITGQHDVELYGLFIDVPPNLATNSVLNSSAIFSDYDSKNIIIGAPGKGNLIKNITGIFFQSNFENVPKEVLSENVKISSNIFGLEEDGETLADVITTAIAAFGLKNLTIGGSTPEEGNILGGSVNYDEQFSYTTNTGRLYISNNFFGSDYTGTNAIDNGRPFLDGGTTLLITGGSLQQLEVSKNIFVARSDLGLTGINCFFKITGNKFGTDITGTKTLGTIMFPLVLGYCNGGGIIGGNDPNDQNIFCGAYKDNPDPDQAKSGVIINIGSPNVELTGNSFKCNYSTYPYQLQGADFSKFFVNIKNRNTNSISGNATANSRVDLYYSLSCNNCEPEKLFKSVNADNNGNWNYNGTLSNNNIIASSTSDGTTSEFTGLKFTNQPTDIKIKMACNNQSNGSITGITATTPATYTWLNESNTIVGHNSNLLNIPPGKYHLIVSDGWCSISSPVYEIQDGANLINTTGLNIKPASCGSSTGYIWGIKANVPVILTWNGGNLSGTVYGTEVSNIPAGSYTFTFTALDGSCPQTISPIIVKNIDGPNIDESTKIIQTTPCGQSIGSIKNITVTGTNPKYSWKNELSQEVATTKDLTGRPAGKYTLQVTDDTECGPVYSSQIEIPETNGITLNIPPNPKTDASCNKANGSIIGITAPGATKFEWRDANNNLAGSDLDLKNIPAGAYQLTASNNFGCSKTTQLFQILELPGTTYPAYTITRKNTCFGETNGSILVTADATVKSLRWVNGQDQTITGNQQISGLAAGTYKLYFTDQNDCESLYNSYTINEIPQLQIIPNTEQKTDDECDLKTGSIKNIQITGGLQPYTYEWHNANNEQISTGISPTGLSAGNYKLIVNDASGCGQAIANYDIAAHSSIIAAPAANNVQLCTPGNALLTVNSTVAGYTYRLYESVNSITPLAEQANGRFTINTKTSTVFYISKVSGSCESSRTEVQVAISLSAINIANTITPNGDGINDYWKIDGIENYPNGQIQIFNRYGQKIFESKGYQQPFNGTFNGKLLPNGAYYYIINLNKNCTLLSGSLTIIR
jgi:gliding motility-associated-like protein